MSRKVCSGLGLCHLRNSATSLIFYNMRKTCERLGGNVSRKVLRSVLEYCQGRNTLGVREVYSQVPHRQNGRKG